MFDTTKVYRLKNKVRMPIYFDFRQSIHIWDNNGITKCCCRTITNFWNKFGHSNWNICCIWENLEKFSRGKPRDIASGGNCTWIMQFEGGTKCFIIDASYRRLLEHFYEFAQHSSTMFHLERVTRWYESILFYLSEASFAFEALHASIRAWVDSGLA